MSTPDYLPDLCIIDQWSTNITLKEEISTLLQKAKDTKLNADEMYEVTKYIMCIILLSNGQRRGVGANMMVKQFEEASVIMSNDIKHYVVQVRTIIVKYWDDI